LFKGNDVLFSEHMRTINDMFLQSKDMQKQREQMLKEMAVLAQMFRDQQLKNMYLMENIDEQVDKIFEIRNHIEYLKKDIINTRKR
jgi:GTP cyclohydrolase II